MIEFVDFDTRMASMKDEIDTGTQRDLLYGQYIECPTVRWPEEWLALYIG